MEAVAALMPALNPADRTAAAQQVCAADWMRQTLDALRRAGIGDVPMLVALCETAGAMVAAMAPPGGELPMAEECAAAVRTSMLAHRSIGGTA